MDLSLLKKRISSYRTEGGRLMKVPDDLALEILAAWEQFPGPAADFYRAIGVDYRKVSSLMSRAKKLKREGVVHSSGFLELTSSLRGTDEVAGEGGSNVPNQAVSANKTAVITSPVVDLTLPDGIRLSFYSVTDLAAFLNQVFPENMRLEFRHLSHVSFTGKNSVA